MSLLSWFSPILSYIKYRLILSNASNLKKSIYILLLIQYKYQYWHFDIDMYPYRVYIAKYACIIWMNRGSINPVSTHSHFFNWIKNVSASYIWKENKAFYFKFTHLLVIVTFRRWPIFNSIFKFFFQCRFQHYLTWLIFF